VHFLNLNPIVIAHLYHYESIALFCHVITLMVYVVEWIIVPLFRYMNLFSPMISVWHNYIVHLQLLHHQCSLTMKFLQMSHNLHSGQGGGENLDPRPPPPPPTLAELMQSVVESQRMLAEAMRQMANRDGHHVRQGPKPNQYSTFKDFMDTKPPIF
jgi:hypothetical protein